MREPLERAARAPAGASPGRLAAARALPACIGNRALSAMAASSPPLPAGRGLVPAAALANATSPPNVSRPAEAEVEDDIELTTPPGTTTPAPAAPVIDATTRQQPASLQVKGSGAIEGSYGISDYWPVTNYWGADKTLGQFTEPLAGHTGWNMIGHKFQVVGRFSSICVAGGGTGQVTFKQEARITDTKGGTPGAWFDDMQYTDAGGGVHHWDPNAESGTDNGNGPGVRRTIAADKYAYTDPPAISYGPDTNTYRKLEFRIHLQPPPGSPDSEILRTATQEIEVKDGVPTVLQAP